jgi:hypothetical protein
MTGSIDRLRNNIKYIDDIEELIIQIHDDVLDVDLDIVSAELDSIRKKCFYMLGEIESKLYSEIINSKL